MEEEEDRNNSRPWSFATNWEVSDGNLVSCITFETPISSSNDDDADNNQQVVVLSEPPSSDSGPCEINVRLAQRHEIRQVYVRSTARIYEIYLTNETCSNDYLCTVRCGIAGKESIPNDASDDKAACAQVDEISKTMKPSEEKVKNDNNSINEDGWVEVKAPSSSSSDSSNNILARKIYGETQNIQDFYEATAEITDSNPCIGFTLRLLSLQTKGCVRLEEIHIFAEPVEPYVSDYPGSAQEKSGESNLLAMRVPTLLQLSKSGVNKVQNRYISDNRDREGLRHYDGDVKETNSFSPNNGRTTSKEPQYSIPFEGEEKVEVATAQNAKSTRSESDEPDPGKQQGLEFATKENDSSCNRTEGLFDQLLHRFGRIETFCIGIEKNMLKSLGSIDTRLQRLEQQMELLTMRSQSPELLYPSIRITAPEFTWNDSETNSRYNDDQNCINSEFSRRDASEKDEFMFGASKSNSIVNDGNDELCCRGSESCHKDVTFDESCKPDASISLVAPQLSPHLVVTAPDFSFDDNDSDGGAADGPEVDDNENDGNDALEMARKGYSTDKPSMSLDDALACALAEFLFSTSAQPPKSGETSMVVVDCPPDENISKNHRLCSAGIQCDVAAESNAFFGESNMTENVKEIESTPCESIQVPSNVTIEAAAVNMARAGPFWEEEYEDGCRNCGMDSNSNQYIRDNDWKNSIKGSLEKRGCKGDAFLSQSDVEAIGDDISFKISDQTASQKQCAANPTVELGSGSKNETLLGSSKNFGQNSDESYDGASKDATDFNDTEVHSARCCKEEFENLPNLAFDGVVDFEFPILDVKFDQEKNWHAGSPLLALLGGRSETIKGDLRAEENDGTASSEPKSKIPVIGEQLLELDDLSVKAMDSNMESNQIEGLSGCDNQELRSIPSLI